MEHLKEDEPVNDFGVDAENAEAYIERPIERESFYNKLPENDSS